MARLSSLYWIVNNAVQTIEDEGE